MTEKTKYCYSLDEEEFCGDFDSREDALADAIAEINDEYEPGDTAVVWVGEVRHAMTWLRKWNHSTGERVIEELDQSLFNVISSEEAILEMSKEDKETLGNIILDFVEKHASFNRWGVSNIEKHEFTVQPEEQ